MEEDKKLYPLKFLPLKDEYTWGSEEFLLSDLGYRDSPVRDGWLSSNTISEVMDTYLDRVVGDKVFDYYGNQFPVAIRRIRVKGTMPLRVHPDDEIAAERYDSLGKDKLWYVLSSGKNARIMLGLREDCDAGTFLSSCADGSVEEHLNVIAPHAGQVLHIAPGTVHAAAGDLDILEISEASAMDFCLCTWGKEADKEEFDPSLDIIGALDFIDLKAWKDRASKHPFNVNSVELEKPIRSVGGDSFVIYTCTEGEVSIRMEIAGLETAYSLKKGETVVIPAEIQEYMVVPAAQKCRIVETTIPSIENADPYINPDAEPVLPGEEGDEKKII